MIYTLLASGNGQKWEQFGPYIIQRPCSQAVWQLNGKIVEKPHAIFSRDDGNAWEHSTLPESWTISIEGITFKLASTDFGHLGIFPEQRPFWKWIQKTIQDAKRPIQVLNLFAYSGGSTLAAAKAGASVCHLDASPGMVEWARENAALNHLEKTPIRWIVDDALKFIKREVKRERRYDAIILDPPSFGRGTKGEVFKIEEHLIPILKECRSLLSDQPLFVLLSCHTPGYTPTTLKYLLEQIFPEGKIDCGEMFLEGDKSIYSVPSGTFGRWLPC